MSCIEIERRGSVAVLWLDEPGEKVNKISPGLLDEFSAALDSIEKDPGIRAAVLASRKDDFIVGADLEKVVMMKAPGEAASLSRSGHAILERLEKFSKPVVAAIRGAALGGGLEVALACHYRIASDDSRTVLALPEIKLGLLPAGGGTQRLPRVVGIRKALEIMLTGKSIHPRRARDIGLVDVLIHPHGLHEAAVQAAMELTALAGDSPLREAREKARRKGAVLERLLESVPPGRRLIYARARKKVLRQTRGNYPAPEQIIDCVEAGTEKGPAEGLLAEERHFDRLVLDNRSKQLVNIFFGMNELRKAPSGDARPVRRVGVLGAGLMGSGIANVSAAAGMDVFLKDTTYAALGQGEKAVWSDFEGKVNRGAMTPFERDIVFTRISGTLDYSLFDRADLVIEAVFEDLDLKRRILADVEAAARDDTIFASNTSSIPITEIAAHSVRPHQVIGMHYFSPVPKMPLLEIVVTDKTDDWVRATCVQAGIRQGKHVIVVKDGPGFYTTRILAPLLNEAMVMLEEGGDVLEIDGAMRRFGFTVGPISLLDVVGIDVGAHVSQVLAPLFTWRGIRTSSSAEKILQAGYKGRKNRRGFYVYDKGRGWPGTGWFRSGEKVNRRIYDFFGGRHRRSFEAREIQDRLALVMVNEAVHCLQEGIIASPRDGDLGAVLGLGFPAFLGGPFRYIDSLGADAVCRRLEELREKNGPRFIAAALLREKASRNGKFYPEA